MQFLLVFELYILLFIFQTEEPRNVGKDDSKLVKEITMRDDSGELKASLWGPAAAHTRIELGQIVTLSDVNTSWSKHYKAIAVNVSHADQVKVRNIYFRPPLKHNLFSIQRLAEIIPNKYLTFLGGEN